MAYIGKTPVVGNFQICDAISVVNGQAAYTLQVGGANVIPESANHMIVSLNGVIQKPGSSFTVSGSTITFASNLATGDSIDFVQILGNVLDIGAPSDATVTTAKLGDSAVTTAKIASSAVDLTSKVTGALPVANGGTNLTSGFANGITMADNWRLTVDFTGNAHPISSNLERNDTAPALSYLGSQMTQSSGVFTFPSTGIYYVTYNASFKLNGDDRVFTAIIQATTDNSTYANASEASSHIKRTNNNETYQHIYTDALFDITDTSNQKVKFRINAGSSVETMANTTRDLTAMRFIRLGDT